MGIDWGAELFYGVDLGEENPRYPHTEDYEPIYPELEDQDIDELLDLVIAVDKPELPTDPWSEEVTAGREYKEYRDDPEWNAMWKIWREAKQEIEDTIPLEHRGYEYNHKYVVKGYYHSTYQTDVIDLGDIDLSVPDETLIDCCVQFCNRYKLPPFTDHGWKLQGKYSY